MHKALVLVKRAEGMAPEEFKEWFLGAHAEHAVEIMGEDVRRYTASFVVAEGPRSPWDGDEPPFDVVAEFWADDLAAVEATYADLDSEKGEVVEVLAHASSRTAVITDEHDLLALHPDARARRPAWKQ